MASTTADPSDLKQPGKARKFTDAIISYLKKDHQMQERMNKMIEAGKSASVASAKGVSAGYDVTKRSSMRAYNILVNYTFKGVGFLIYAILAFLFLPDAFSMLTQIFLQVAERAEGFLPLLSDFTYLLNWMSLYFTIFILGSLLIMAFPIMDFAYKEEIYSKLAHLYLIIGILLLVGGLLYGFFFTTGYTFNERTDQVSTQVEESTSSIFSTVTCYMDTACINKKINQDEAEQAKTSDYSLSYSPPRTATPFYTDMNTEEIYLDYTYKSSGGMYLNSITCYHEKVSEETKFYEKTFDENLGESEVKQPLRNIKCGNLFDIPRKGSDETYDIITQLSLTIEGKYSQQIPVVNFVPTLENEIPADKKRTTRELRTYLHRQTEEFTTFKQNNDALRVATGNLLPQLPIIIGEGEEDILAFLFTIEEKSNVEFGTFEEGAITDIALPPTLKFKEETTKEDYLTELELNSDQIFERQITLVEDATGLEQSANDITSVDEAVNIYDLQFLTTATFTKENRFQIRIIDEDYGESGEETISGEDETADSSSENPGQEEPAPSESSDDETTSEGDTSTDEETSDSSTEQS